ncbi:MAG: tRNA (adenosine(37)-N6)-dimethylallyltransferase MiaA [Rhodospirillaceae bacterium]
MTDFIASENPPNQPPVLIVAGPTASGKSALAMQLAERLGGIIINADSMQVYRELRVVTARPTAEDEARVPHRLFGVLPAAERCSVGRWLAMATDEIQAARAAGFVPIVTGGTGMYLKMLTDGLAPVPEVPADIHADAGTLYDDIGSEAFVRRLAELDPKGAAKLPPGDRQRLIRAYGVAKSTGRPLGDWQADQPPGPAVDGEIRCILINPGREVLYAACDARFGRMLADGALDEVRALATQNLPGGLPAMRALGVPDLLAHIRGEVTLDQAADRARQATRNFAKRQMTWFRNQMTPRLVLQDAAAGGAAMRVIDYWRSQPPDR